MSVRVAGARTAATCAVRHPGGVVMQERFDVSSRCGNAPPKAEDAHRIRSIRRITAAHLRSIKLDEMVDVVTVIVSELLTNALLHSGTSEISLHLAIENGMLTIAVRDGQPGCATIKLPSNEDESGRGLLLVESLVQECGGAWGTRDAGAETWCCLAIPAAKGQS